MRPQFYPICFALLSSLSALAAPAEESSVSYLNRCKLESDHFKTREGGCKDLSTGIVWSRVQSPKNYVEAARACEGLVVGPYADWELPPIARAARLAERDVVSRHFRFQPVDFYWVRAEGTADTEAAALAFTTGDDEVRSKDQRLPFVCSRRGASTEFGCLIDDDYFATMEGGCQLLRTKLIWSAGLTDDMSHEAAVRYCESLREGGKTDWRTPTLEELSSAAGSHLGLTHLRVHRQQYYWAVGPENNYHRGLVAFASSDPWAYLFLFRNGSSELRRSLLDGAYAVICVRRRR